MIKDDWIDDWILRHISEGPWSRVHGVLAEYTAAVKRNVERGFLEEYKPGWFRLTPAGTLYASVLR